jgi:hypothetical protein
MSEVTRILSAIEQGDPQAAEQLLPLVYDELRRLAAQKLAQERPGQTLEATALVPEAYLRLGGAYAKDAAPEWQGRAGLRVEMARPSNDEIAKKFVQPAAVLSPVPALNR